MSELEERVSKLEDTLIRLLTRLGNKAEFDLEMAKKDRDLLLEKESIIHRRYAILDDMRMRIERIEEFLDTQHEGWRSR